MPTDDFFVAVDVEAGSSADGRVFDGVATEADAFLDASVVCLVGAGRGVICFDTVSVGATVGVLVVCLVG